VEKLNPSGGFFMPKPIMVKNLDRLGNCIYLNPGQGLIVEPENPNCLKKFNCFSDLLLDTLDNLDNKNRHVVQQIYNLNTWCQHGDVFLGEISTWKAGDGAGTTTSLVARRHDLKKKPENLFVISPTLAEVIMEAHQKLIIIVYNDMNDIEFIPKVYPCRAEDALNVELVNSYKAEYYYDSYFWVKQSGSIPYKIATPPMSGDDTTLASNKNSLFGYSGLSDKVKVYVYEFILNREDLKKAALRKSGFYNSSSVEIEYADESGADEKSWHECNLKVFVSKNKGSINEALANRPDNLLDAWVTKEIIKSRSTETSPNGKEMIFPDLLNNALFFDGQVGVWTIWIPRSSDSKYEVIASNSTMIEGCSIIGEVIEPITIHGEDFSRIAIVLTLTYEAHARLTSKKNLAISMAGAVTIIESLGEITDLHYKCHLYYEGAKAKHNASVIKSLRNKSYNTGGGYSSGYPRPIPVKSKNKKIRFKEHFKEGTMFFGYVSVVISPKPLLCLPGTTDFETLNNTTKNNKLFIRTKLFMQKLYGTDDIDYDQDPWRYIRKLQWINSIGE